MLGSCDMLNLDNLWIGSTIWPANISILAINKQVDILVGPFLVIGYTKLDSCTFGAIGAEREDNNLVPLV